jgi:hypothetical protein
VQLADLDLTQGLLALLNAPDTAVPEASASLPGNGRPSAAAAADPDARREAIRRVASAPSGPDELPACSVRRSSSGLAVNLLRSSSGGINTPKVGGPLGSKSFQLVADQVFIG